MGLEADDGSRQKKRHNLNKGVIYVSLRIREISHINNRETVFQEGKRVGICR